MIEISSRHARCAAFRCLGAAVAAALSQGALAQSLPSSGNGIVRIASPGTGARVGGTVAVEAETVVAPALIRGVQFRLDGNDLGEEDSAPPYRASWDADAVDDGWHTLTAIARDAGGRRYTSEPVTVRVANEVAVPAAAQRFEDTDPALSYSAGWTQRNPDDWLAWSAGSAMQSMAPGARATFAFSGTSVTWIGYRSTDSGIARVFVDGVHLADVDLLARKDEVGARAYTVAGLRDDEHRLTIEVTGLKNPESALSNVVVDAFKVPARAVSRVQESDPAIDYTGAWEADASGWPWNAGDARMAAAPGARARLTFDGSAVVWIGYRGPDAGIARVLLDGRAVAEVDAYAASPRLQETLFSVRDLAAGTHTLAIEATGRGNAEASDTRVQIDAFDVTRPGERFEETAWAVTYAGDWTHGNRNRPWSEGTAAVSSAAGARASFAFTGTSVSWLGLRAARTGIARVYVDGEFVALVDTYVPAGDGYQNVVYTLSGLADARHTLSIEVTGTKNPAATNNYVVVDAFDVRR